MEHSLDGAAWVVCASGGGLKPALVDSLHAAHARGVVVTIGPRAPELDGSMRPLRRPLDVEGFEIEPLDDLARADALVAKRIDELRLPTWPDRLRRTCTSPCTRTRRAPRVVFVMNPTGEVQIGARVAGRAPRRWWICSTSNG